MLLLYSATFRPFSRLIQKHPAGRALFSVALPSIYVGGTPIRSIVGRGGVFCYSCMWVLFVKSVWVQPQICPFPSHLWYIPVSISCIPGDADLGETTIHRMHRRVPRSRLWMRKMQYSSYSDTRRAANVEANPPPHTLCFHPDTTSVETRACDLR